MIAALGLMLGLIYGLASPVTRFLPPGDNATISYPLVAETCPNGCLFGLTVGVPIACALIWLLVEFLVLNRIRLRRWGHELHDFLLCWGFVFVATLLVVQILKIVVGYYRPNFLAKSQGDGDLFFPKKLKNFCFNKLQATNRFLLATLLFHLGSL
jgi:hypothetical protein